MRLIENTAADSWGKCKAGLGLEVGWDFIPISFLSSFLLTMMPDEVTEKFKVKKEKEGLFLPIQTEESEEHSLIEQANGRTWNCIYYLLVVCFGEASVGTKYAAAFFSRVSNKLGLHAGF